MNTRSAAGPPGTGGPPWPCSPWRSSPSPPPPSTPATRRADPADPQRNRHPLRHADHQAGARYGAPAATVCLAAAPPAPRQNLPLPAASQAVTRSPGVRSLSYDVAPNALRRASATHLHGCRARCRCCSDADRLGTGRLVQRLWRDYPVLINRGPGETRNMRRMSGSTPPENIRDPLYREDGSAIRTRSGPRAMAALRNLAIGALHQIGKASCTDGV